MNVNIGESNSEVKMHPLDYSTTKVEQLFSGPFSMIVCVLMIILSFAAIYLLSRIIS